MGSVCVLKCGGNILSGSSSRKELFPVFVPYIANDSHAHFRVSAAQCVGRRISTPPLFPTYFLYIFFCFTNFLSTDSSESTFVTSRTILLSYSSNVSSFSAALQIKTASLKQLDTQTS